MMLIAGRLSRLQWGVVAFFALHFAVNSLAGLRPRFTFIFLALLLLAAVEAVRRLLWVSRPVAGNAVLALLALFLGAKAIALHIRDVAQIAELNAPARVLTEWFRERGDAEGQAIHVHPHDPARATLGRGAGPAPVAAWYRLSRDAWVDQVPLGSWVFYNPRFDSDGRFARALTENLPEGWSEVTVPGLAPARLFLCGPDAEMRGRPGVGLAGRRSGRAALGGGRSRARLTDPSQHRRRARLGRDRAAPACDGCLSRAARLRAALQRTGRRDSAVRGPHGDR